MRTGDTLPAGFERPENLGGGHTTGAELEVTGREQLAAGDAGAAVATLRRALIAEPARLSAARALIEAAAQGGTARAEHLARSLVSLVDPSVANPERLPSMLPSELNGWLRDQDTGSARALWRILWDHALPLFRERTGRSLEPNDRVTRIATSPVSRAFGRALDALLIVDLPVFYHSRAGDPELRLYRTSPATIFAANEFATDEATMGFELGRVIELSRADHILLATLPEERARAVTEAVRAAFGPADSDHDISRDAAAIASDLWGTIPARMQAEVRELLVSTSGWSDLDKARTRTVHAGDRAGLFACGELSVAIRALARHEISDEAGLEKAMGNERARKLTRFAFREVAEH